MIIAGAKGFAKELLQVYYRDFSKRDISFFDNINEDIEEALYEKFPIIKTKEILLKKLAENPEYLLGVGTPKARMSIFNLFNKAGGELRTIISKRATIGYFGVEIGDGCTIVDGVIITNDIILGMGSLINLNVTIGHDSVVGNFCDISPDVNISGHCKIGDYCSIGTGSVLIPGVTIGNNVVIGAGAVVVKSIPSNSLCVGAPAKVIRELPLFEFNIR